jgi:hypothetical protein
MQERRAAERLRIDLKVRWEALRTQGRGAVCDLGSLGCFVLTSAEVRPGDLIRLEINFPEEIVSLWGHVVYAVAEIGFAVRFAFADDADTHALSQLIESMNRS